MKILILTFIAFIVIPTSVLAQVPETVTMKIGESKKADAGKLKIAFLEIVEDSRCPVGANCVWAGNAKIKLSVSIDKKAATIVELNSNLDPQAAKIFGYKLKFESLTPRPSENPKTESDPAAAVVTISKSCKSV